MPMPQLPPLLPQWLLGSVLLLAGPACLHLARLHLAGATPSLRAAVLAETALPQFASEPVSLVNTTFASLRGFSYQPYFPSVGGTGAEIWGNPAVFDIDSIEADFAAAKQLFPKTNMMRLWMSLDGYISNPAGYAAQLGAVLGLGPKHGYRFIVTLFNDWQSMPDWGGGVAVSQRDYGTGGTSKSVPQQFLEAVVLPHAENLAVLVWDVMNEPKPEMREVVDSTAQWLRNEAKVSAHIGVSAACNADDCLRTWNSFTDVLIIHPYCMGCFDGGPHEDLMADFSAGMDQAVRYANERGLPLITTETCWGALSDAVRARSCSFELGELAKRNIGICPHGLRYSKVADLHDFAGGPVGPSGFMAFMMQNRSLRPYHDFYNNF